ncbi:MAG: hypothetical protein JNM17_15585 [Archangium sp.]|nr:hypothetical protein [Archangium sp.]
MAEMLVLICEEDDDARAALVEAARAAGHTTMAMADIREAEEAITTFAVGAVIADLLVISLASLLRPTAMRVLITSVPNMLTQAELAQFGVRKVLLKPLGQLGPLVLEPNDA